MDPPLGNISPLAPRDPLPGQQNGHFRPQSVSPSPQNSPWSSNPLSGGDPESQEGGFGSPTQREYQSPQQGARGFVARAPTGERSLERERATQREQNGQENVRRSAEGNGGTGELGFVRVKVVGLEKNRRDIYVKFNAESNLPTYRSKTYRSVSRPFSSFEALHLALSVSNPQTIIPALPLSQSSAATEEEDDRIVKLEFQRWFGRVCSDPAVKNDEELRGFIEGEFGYTPSTSLRRKTPSSFHFPRGSRAADEQDDPLSVAKAATTRLELTFSETSKVISSLAKARKAVGAGYGDVGERLVGFSATEVYGPLANGWKRLGRSMRVLGDLQGALATAELVTLGDALNYQAANAKSAKETLISRDVILSEHRSAVKATRSKRDIIERLKNSSSIKAERVDDALDELEDAKKYETLLAQRLQNISSTLQPSLRTHSRNAHEDVFAALLDHARSSLLYERQVLKELELLRPELAGIKKPEAGVYYHQSPSIQAQQSPANRQSDSLNSASLSPSSINRHNLPPSPQQAGGMSKSMFVNRSGPLGDDAGSIRSVSSSSSTAAPRLSINSLAKSVVVPDQRQRVDARMAASMLSSGF